MKKSKRNNFYASNITLILLCCLVSLGINTIFNITKVISFNQKLKQVRQYYMQANNMRTILKDEIENFEERDAETVLRNNLKMIAEDEIRIDVVED